MGFQAVVSSVSDITDLGIEKKRHLGQMMRSKFNYDASIHEDLKSKFHV